MRLNIHNFLALCFSVSLFCLIPSFYVWNVPQYVFIFICICICLYEISTRMISNAKMIFAFLIILFYLYIGERDGISIMGISLYLLMFGTLFLLPNLFIKDVLHKFISLYSILLIPSIIVFIAVVYLKVPLPHDTIEPINVGKDYNYFHFPFLLVPNLPYMQQLRFHAYFDEPGVVGTISAILLACNKFNFRNIINLPIFISGLLSLSLVFYLIFLMYVLLFSSFRQKIIIAIPTIIIIGLLSSNQFFSHLIIDRLLLTSNGGIEGNNRTSGEMDMFFKTFICSTKSIFGYGNHFAAIINYGGSSYKDLIIDYGIFGFLFMTFIYFSYAVKMLFFSKDLIIYLFIYLIIIYQRPYITLYFYVFLLFAPLFFLNYNHRK